ncbi:MAG TPA: lipoyl synthase [Candidatus Saccharimonadales bacterium]|nr:lipoyl synthase [Candidatus Saccharimonadales bacterium]
MPRFSKTLQIQQQPFDKPEWLRVRYPSGENYDKIKEILRNRNLHTVCEEAHCPNIAECWGGGTATFMLLGDTCTRGCRFCMVKSGNPRGELDIFEPTKVAETVAALQLKYVVLTSVDRDDLADGGASHFSFTIKAIRQRDPKVIIEVLIPDFNGRISDIQRVIDAEPDVIAHNIETTESLTPKIRDPRATYQQSLRVLRTLKDLNLNIFSKSSIMLGLGETESDIRQTLCDLRNVKVDILTLGQYLRPSKGHVPLVEYVSPERFNYYKHVAEQLGFLYVAAGPFVRSSYRAGEFFLESLIRRNKTTS